MTSVRTSRKHLSLMSRPGKRDRKRAARVSHAAARPGPACGPRAGAGKRVDAKDSDQVAFTGPAATRAVFLVSRRSGGA